QVIDGQPEPPLQASDPAAQRQPRDAGMPDDADRADEAVLLGSEVEVPEQRAAAGPCEPPRRVDADLVHAGQVDHEAAVGRRVADRAVPAAAYRDLEVALAPESDGGLDVGDARGSHDERGPPIEHRVPDASRSVIAGRLGLDDLAAEGPS